GLSFDDIESSPSQTARIQLLEQGELIDDRAACRVDQEGAGTHACQCAGIDEVVGRVVEVAVQADEVTLFEQVFESVATAVAEGLVDALGEGGVVEDDIETEGLGPEGGGRADPAAADQAQRLPPEPWGADRRPVVPLPRADGRVAGDQLARQCEE